MATTEATQQTEQTNVNVDDAVLAPTRSNSILVEPTPDAPEADGQGQETDATQKTIDRMGNELGELRKRSLKLASEFPLYPGLTGSIA